MQWIERFVDLTARRPQGWLGRRLYRDPAAHRAGFAAILEALQIRPGERVLEIGCGGGVLLADLLARGARAGGLDHSTDMLVLAAQRNAAALAGGRLELHQGDAGTLPWPDASFDAVAAAHMFFFVAEPDRMLREALRVLRPGGRLAMVTVPAGAARWVFLPWAAAMYCYGDAQLAAMLARSGFINPQVRTAKTARQLVLARKPK